MGKLALVFIWLPLAELLTLIRLGHVIGGWPTFLLVLASAVVGGLLARAEGLRVIAQLRQAFSTGELPSEQVLNGVLILGAAALLILPGVITDVLALVLLIPWSRRLLAARLLAGIERALATGKMRVVAQARSGDAWRGGRVPQAGANGVIDTEGETVESSVVDADDAKPPRLNP